MGRIRTIKPEFPQSESMGRVSRESRLCFILLFTLADDAGRLRGNSRMLASLLYPYDDDAKKHIDSWLAELHKEDCITRYEADGDQYIQLNKWLQHQKIDKPSPSKIPSPEDSQLFANPREDSSADQGRDQGREGIKYPPVGFEDFWNAWPKNDRKQDKRKCLAKWESDKLDEHLKIILADIELKKLSDKWMTGYIEAPLVYLNNRRWEDGTAQELEEENRWSTRKGVEEIAAQIGLEPWNQLEQWDVYLRTVRTHYDKNHSAGAH